MNKQVGILSSQRRCMCSMPFRRKVSVDFTITWQHHLLYQMKQLSKWCIRVWNCRMILPYYYYYDRVLRHTRCRSLIQWKYRQRNKIKSKQFIYTTKTRSRNKNKSWKLTGKESRQQINNYPPFRMLQLLFSLLRKKVTEEHE